MDDMEAKLGAILGNPDMMAQIMSMAQSLGQSPPEPPPKQEPPSAMPDIDPAMIGKLMNLAVDDMVANGVDFSSLGGQRQRYGYFSF